MSLHVDPPAQIGTDLFRRFDEALRSGALEQRVPLLPKTERSLTSALEQAAIVNLMHLLAPAHVLEIGTYFAGTTRVFAQTALEVGGSVVTIDPGGASRVPPAMAKWSERERSVTKFFPQSSMDYFFSLYLDGKITPFNLIYVDGDHAYHYATFDLLSSALYCKPGGVVVVDNIDVAGVRVAVRNFLKQRSHWRLYDDGVAGKYPFESIRHSFSSILFAPPGVEIGEVPIRIFRRRLDTNIVNAVELSLVPAGARGKLDIFANLFFTGQGGMLGSKAHVTVEIEDDSQPLKVIFDKPLSVSPQSPGVTHIELELSFEPSPEGTKNLLLGGDSQIGLF